MNRRRFVQTAASLPFFTGLTPLAVALAPADQGAPRLATTPDSAHATGPLQERFALTLQRVLHGDSPSYTDEFVLADVRPTPERRFTEYSGDVSGRYIGALATAASVYGTKTPGLDSLVDKVIALQKPDGYFGSSFHYDNPGDLDMALLWGNGRLLVGLLEYYQLRQSPAALAAARRIGDFMVRIAPLMLSNEIRASFGAQHFASSYICWTQQTEGLALLYAITHDERYRHLAEQIAAVIERRPSDHAHGYLTSLRGVMVLHASTHGSKLLQQCETAWNDITQSKDLLITGGVPEGWSPNGHRTEGCGECDWVRLNLSLWQATANPKYLSMAERAIFNELAFNQFATGDFGHHVYTETGLPAGGAVRAWWCCTLHGLRVFPDISQNVFREHESGLHYDLPLDGRIETSGFAAVASSSLAQNGKVRITIIRAPQQATVLAVRTPSWASSVAIRIKGSDVHMPLEDGYVGAKRTWSPGDQVEVAYAMNLHSLPSGESRVSYTFGPWLLGAPASDNFHYFNEITADNKLIGEGKPAADHAAPDASSYAVPLAATTFRYEQAEYPDQPANVTLRPIAEQTGQPTTSWELRFLTKDQA